MFKISRPDRVFRSDLSYFFPDRILDFLDISSPPSQSTYSPLSLRRNFIWLFLHLARAMAWKNLLFLFSTLNHNCFDLCFRKISCWVRISASSLVACWFLWISSLSLRPLVVFMTFLHFLTLFLKFPIKYWPRADTSSMHLCNFIGKHSLWFLFHESSTISLRTGSLSQAFFKL